MLSLAAFRYRNVLTLAGGPIERLEIMDTEVLDERAFIANAYLKDGIIVRPQARELYSQANGSGTAPSAMVARFMAISEAMERWAHWHLHESSEGPKYGFDVDPSSNGLAAFPGFFSRQARHGALLEAVERFNLLNWWEGRLPAIESETRWPGVRAVTICSEMPGFTVVVYKRTDAGFFAYGHGAGRDFESACRKAAMEMERHDQVVTSFATEHGGKIRDQLPRDAHPIERRSLFFALDEGHELFLERVRSQPAPTATAKLVYDGPVPGPWSRYADVWRVVYEPPSRRFLGLEENYFLW